jgi:hypothetical protein
MSKLANAILACATLLVAACASTTLQTAWYDTTYAGGPFKRILVVGVGANVANRRAFEDIFSQKLSATGTQGVPGYQFLPDDARANEPAWDAGIAQSGADALLVVRVLGVDTKTQVSTMMVPGPMYGGPYYRGWWGPQMYSVPQVTQYDVADVEASLFDVKTKRIVWAATTETVNPSSVAKETPGYADVIIKQFQARGLIASAK